jgi:ABC-type tungstate transport system permease subunit
VHARTCASDPFRPLAVEICCNSQTLRDPGVDIANDKGPWYKEIGQGMGAALNMASASNAYVCRIAARGLPFRIEAISLSLSRATDASLISMA